MTITQKTDYIAEILRRRMSQYVEKDNLEGALRAYAKQAQEIEDILFDMLTSRVLRNAVGQQLDNIGVILDQPRGGFDDDFYRILLYVKIGQNTSGGDARKIISIFKLLTEAGSVHYMNLGNGNVDLAADVLIDEDKIDFVYSAMERVAAGGVRINQITCYDPDEAFSFAGNNTVQPGLGFSDITGTTGGKLSVLHILRIPFAFDGNSKVPRGFGSFVDPIVGGTLVGIGEF